MEAEKSIEKGTSKVFDIVKGIAITAIPVVIGFAVYDLLVAKQVAKLKTKMGL